MAEAFDAYYVWLGIGPEEQPANHYRLLGIRLFEPNPEVIDSAADRQMAHLRTFQQGKNAALSQQLLNEVSAARVCLLNPTTKAAYDAQLRAMVGQAMRPAAPTSGIHKTIPAAGAQPLPGTSLNLPVASPLSRSAGPGPTQTATNWDALIGSDAGPAASRTSTRRVSSTARRKPNNQFVYIISAAAVVLAACVGLVIYINGREGEPPPHDAQAAKPVEPQTGKPDKTSAAASSQGAAQPVAPPRDVMLSIDWPVADREDARLTIDGKDQPLDAIKLEFSVAPGRHVIQLTRDGFEPIWQTLDIGSQPLPPLAPHWISKAAVAAADGPTPPGRPAPANGGDGAAATQAGKQKLSIPSTAEQTEIAKRLDETYKAEHASEKDHALAVQLFETADEPGNSPAERYVLLTKAAELAAGAGDFELAFRRGIEALNLDYEIDPFEMKEKLLQDSLKSIAVNQQVVAIDVVAEQVINEALADDRYDTALKIAATAKKAAGNPHAEARFRNEATDRIGRRVREIEAIRKAAAVAIEAEATLEKSPDDPAANLTFGRWYCLYKRDWDRGLPLLAKGPDGAFKALAKQELAVDLTLKPQLDLADGWWDVGQKESGIARDSARLHAGEIYRLQLPNIQAGLKKTAVQQRLKEIDAVQQLPSGHGREIDLLKLVNLKRDASGGNWQMKGGELFCDAGHASRVQFDYQPPEEYDFEIAFTRTEGREAIVQICSAAERQFVWVMDGFNSGTSAFERVLSQNGGVGSPSTALALVNGRRYVSVVKVRRDGVQAFIDGALISECKTNYSDVEPPGSWVPLRPNQLGLGAWEAPTVFHSAKVIEITGIGKVGKRQTNVPTKQLNVESRAASPNRFPKNRWVDVLGLVDTAKHAVKGTWSRDGTVVSCAPEGEARVEVPVAIDGSYDLDVEFTRTDGDADVTAVFTVGGRQCSILLSMDHGGLSGIDRVDGKRPWDDGNPTVTRPGTLTNGRAYVLLISVRQTKPDHASVDIYLDGKPYLPHWEGNPASLSLDGAWSLPDSRELGLGGWNTHVTFHSMRLKLVAGQATRLASKNASLTPELPVN